MYAEFIEDWEPVFGNACLICGETMPVWGFSDDRLIVCDKCKAAVMAVRKRMDDYESGRPILD